MNKTPVPFNSRITGDVANESQETRRFDSEQIRASGPHPGLVLRQRYRLDSEIGRGAMGVVFRATDLELLRPVAVKVLSERMPAESSGEEGKRGTGNGKQRAQLTELERELQ